MQLFEAVGLQYVNFLHQDTFSVRRGVQVPGKDPDVMRPWMRTGSGHRESILAEDPQALLNGVNREVGI